MNPKKSIGIVNPHTTMFGYPLSWRLQGRPYVAKAKPILDIFQENFEVNLISDGSETSFGAIRRSGMTKIIANYEMTMWRRAEKLEKLRVVSGYEKSDVNIVSWWNIGGGSRLLADKKKNEDFFKGNYKKILYLNHPHEYMELLRDSIHNFDCVISELMPSDITRKYFGLPDEKLLNIPYFVSDRFINSKNMDVRESKLLIMGSINRLKNEPAFEEYKKVFKSDYLHSERVKMLSKALDGRFVEVKMLVDSRDTSNQIVDPYRQGISFEQYFKFDINEELNKYKLFNVSGEDIGVPPISFFEGVKAGAVYFGRRSEWLERLGLQHGKHFIEWSGDIDTINDEIRFTVTNFNLLEISEKCNDKVNDHHILKIKELVDKI